MKKILSIFIIIATVSILLISNNTIAGPAWVPPGGAKPSTECNAEAYYADGTLCHDTDDDKLYLGTGAAVLQILSATSIGTIATQNSDNATITGGNVTGLTNLERAKSYRNQHVERDWRNVDRVHAEVYFVDGSPGKSYRNTIIRYSLRQSYTVRQRDAYSSGYRSRIAV